MSFVGRALGQFVSRWMTDNLANSAAMRQTAKVAVKGVKTIRGTAKNVGTKAGVAAHDAKTFASDFIGELKHQVTSK